MLAGLAGLLAGAGVDSCPAGVDSGAVAGNSWPAGVDSGAVAG